MRIIIAEGNHPSHDLPEWLNFYWKSSLAHYAAPKTDYNVEKDYQNFYYRMYPERAVEIFGTSAGNYGLLELAFYEDENGIINYSLHTSSTKL